MANRKNTVLGLEYTLNAPTTVAEAVEICGGDESLLVEHFVQKLIYNHHNADVRATFCEKVEEQTGIARKTDKKTTAAGKEVEVYAETETEYFQRALAETGSEAEEFVSTIQEVADGSPLDGKKKVRATGAGPRIGKTFLKLAEQIIEKGSQEKASAVLSAELDHSVGTDATSLAVALKERDDRKRREFAEQVGALL